MHERIKYNRASDQTEVKMETRKKLEEARFFLEEFRKSVRGVTEKKSSYYLSAFLGAWRSVLDVMLYDFAKYYSLGLTQEDKVGYGEFLIVAKAQSNDKALDFLKWWAKKIQKLSKNKLWKMRRVIIHRGYPEIMQVYVPPTISSSAFAIPKEADAVKGYIARGKIIRFEYTTLPKDCKNAFRLVEDIVTDAEKKFNVKL